ncbi:MAG: Xaa-Pro peptidase family protein [Bryobacteraceae bacterium]
MLTKEGCKRRQARLQLAMQEHSWDMFVTANFRTVYYFTGILVSATTPAIFVLRQDGRSVAISAAQTSESLCVDTLLTLETYSIERCITGPMRDAVSLLSDALAPIEPPVRRCAVERSATPGIVDDAVEKRWSGVELADASDTVLKLRKCKEPDEVDEIRRSLHYCATAYQAARDTIAPGLTELDVYNAMYAAVVREAGTSIVFAGDFACGQRCVRSGGPPTRRKLESQDLYIIDLFPAEALYIGDTCRTFAVGKPTGRQMEAWELVRQALHLAEEAIRPGGSCREAYATIKTFLDSHEIAGKSFWHHLGHGIGHNGHEAPRIIPGSNDVFEVGDVIAVEPAIYSAGLNGGIRLENDYLVTSSGLERLFDFPLDL